jgi:4,5-DOPA dioxygenase extradiol
MTAATLMPAAFIGHGSPMNTLESNRYTSAWRALGRVLPLPRAVLAISAHWYVNGSAVTAMQQPRVIHDFFGFPRKLFEFDYPAPGSPEVAQEIADLLQPTYVGLDRDSWGLDHGTWSVLAHVFPEANVPVVQLSINANEEIGYHFELGERLAALRQRGVFILGSGNVVHNLRLIDWKRVDGAFDWGVRFDSEVKRIMTSRPKDILAVSAHPDHALAVPTPEHFLPLPYLAGLCHQAGEPAEVLIEGGALGSITMTSYLLGCRGLPHPLTDHGPAAALPDPDVVPPENTNT